MTIVYEQKVPVQPGVREQIEIDEDILSGRASQHIAADFGLTVRTVFRRRAFLRAAGVRVPDVDVFNGTGAAIEQRRRAWSKANARRAARHG